ncbi:MAG: UTRA domain-containing protein [Erysipelotrichia bacterium]|nr:UTRA domain-containing protein [Erysipelotrichia bacterium]
MNKNENIYVIRQLDKFESITESVEALGFSYQYNVLTQSVVEANKMISEMLQIPIATKVFSYRKLRIIEGKPRSLEHTYIEYSKVKNIEKADLENQSLYRYLRENYKYKIGRSEEEIRIVQASEEESQLLKIKNHSEVLMTTGISYLSGVEPFEYSEVIAIPSFFRFRSVNE